MTAPAALADFPVTRRWPPRHPDRIQLYAANTPNGLKPVVLLEELGIPYELQRVSFADEDQMTPEFLSLSPNNKIPAMLDPDGPGGRPLGLFESGAILIYLAEKAGRLIPADVAERYRCLQWLMWQMGGVGPMFGQLGWFVKFAGKAIDDPRPRLRYVEEAERLLAVLDEHLAGRDWLVDDYSIADIALFPWLHNLVEGYGAGDLVDWDDLDNVPGYLARCMERPASRRAVAVLAGEAA